MDRPGTAYGSVVLAMIRSPHDEVVAALRDDGVGTVSPTSASGWTAAWLAALDSIRPLGDHFAVDGAEEDRITLHLRLDNRSSIWTLEIDDADGDSSVCNAAAQALGELLDEPHPQQIRRALGAARDADELVDNLLEGRDLPDPWGPATRRAVTLHRGNPASARIAARIAAGGSGTTGLARLTGGWSVIRSDPHFGDLPLTVPTVSPGRRALGLWRGEGEAAGFELLDRTGTIAEGRWNTGWRDLEADGWQSRDAAAWALVQAFGDGDGDANLIAVRTLVRARRWHGDPLAELVALLSIPGDAVGVLDGREGAPELRPMTPAPTWRLVWEAMRDGPWVTARWLRISLASYALVVGLVALSCAAVKYAALANDVETATSDVVFAILFTVVAPLNLWCGVQIIRRGTFF